MKLGLCSCMRLASTTTLTLVARGLAYLPRSVAMGIRRDIDDEILARHLERLHDEHLLELAGRVGGHLTAAPMEIA